MYKKQKPITTLDILNKEIPDGETVPFWWDDGWYLFYRNMWKNIYYMSPKGQGELHIKKFFLYKNKPQPEFVVEQREFRKWECSENEMFSTYHCPNCEEDLVPYNYDFERQFIGHLARVKYCPNCGYPLLW